MGFTMLGRREDISGKCFPEKITQNDKLAIRNNNLIEDVQ
jgi:hypothetical protein